LPVLCCGIIAAGVYAASVTYDGRAVPGSRLGDTDVSGMEPKEIEQTAQRLFDSTVITIKINDERASASPTKLTVKPADLNMALDPKATAENVMAEADSEFILIRYLPLPTKHTILSMTYSTEALKEFLRKSHPASFTDPEDPQVSYNRETQTFEVQPQKSGLGISDDEANRIAYEVASNPGEVTIELNMSETKAAISDEAANQAADKAKALLGAHLNFTVEGGGKAAATEDDIGGMVVFKPDAKNGTITREISPEKAVDYVRGALTDKLGTAPENMKTIEDGNGRVLLTVSKGKEGTQVADAPDVAAKIVAALKDAAPLDLTVTLEKKEVGVTPVVPEEGERWAEVNLTKQRAYIYEGNKLIRECVISSGTAKHRTRVGSFKVWLKVRIQDMKGGNKEDGSYYYTKNVPWITYFDGGIGFHYAYWHNNFGRPMSHGCINMKLSDAKYTYDYLKKGDRVIVHY
jgi:lipoprotein-anchoring transpeptidase ErfK/SrfK